MAACVLHNVYLLHEVFDESYFLHDDDNGDDDDDDDDDNDGDSSEDRKGDRAAQLKRNQ